MRIKNSLVNRLGISILVLSIGLTGCNLRDSSKDFSKVGSYNGFKTSASSDGSGRRASITDTTGNRMGVYLWDKSETGAFYTITVDGELPKDHPLWQYANRDSLERIYETIKSQAVKEQ